jgi:RNA polymerase sigma factor (sigma-70 family)
MMALRWLAVANDPGPLFRAVPSACLDRPALALRRIGREARAHAVDGSSNRMARTRESHEWTDEEVLRACRDGHARAWRELVRRYTRLVLGIARTMGLQSDDADEVFQLTFSTLFRSLSRLRQPDRIEAWLVTASRRATLRVLRDRRRHLRIVERHARAGENANAPPADERIETLRERERAARALRSLAEPCRTLLTALFADDRVPYRELAARLGLAVGSLGSRRARCLERLRRRLLLALNDPRPVRPGAGPPVREHS